MGMDNVVFIGLPASETGNALAIPLAGHELGHNVWRTYDLQPKYNQLVGETVEDVIKGELFQEYKEEFAEIQQPRDVSTMYGQNAWAMCWSWALAQLQEIFCDYVGLAIFREAFLWSFAYLLAPGLGRSPTYPDIVDRVDAQLFAAETIGISPLDNYKESFVSSTVPDDSRTRLWLKTGSIVCKRLLDRILDEALFVVGESPTVKYSCQQVREVYDRFNIGVPVQRSYAITNIVNAGWKFYHDGFGSWKKDYPNLLNDPSRPESMLSDLVFKSIEVSEILSSDHIGG